MGHRTYVPGDPHQTSYREGERNVVLYIIAHANAQLREAKNFQQEMDHGGRERASRYT